MKEKKGIIIGIIIAIMIVVLAVFIILVTRNAVILSSINSKIMNLEENTKNVYKKYEFENGVLESYILENKRKDVLNGEISQVVAVKDETIGSHYPIFSNPIDNTAPFSEKIKQILNVRIKNVEVEGQKCYELTETRNVYTQGEEIPKKKKIYIEKDTGLVIKEIHYTETNEKEKIYTVKTTYIFNEVKEEDFLE